MSVHVASSEETRSQKFSRTAVLESSVDVTDGLKLIKYHSVTLQILENKISSDQIK